MERQESFGRGQRGMSLNGEGKITRREPHTSKAVEEAYVYDDNLENADVQLCLKERQ